MEAEYFLTIRKNMFLTTLIWLLAYKDILVIQKISKQTATGVNLELF